MSNTNILALSDSELYILACVLGSVQYNENSSSLLCKVHEVSDKKFELVCEDYEKVVFYVNDNGDSKTGKVKTDQFVTIAFEGGNVDFGSNGCGQAEPVKEVSLKQLVIDELAKAIKEGNLDAVKELSSTLATVLMYNN